MSFIAVAMDNMAFCNRGLAREDLYASHNYHHSNIRNLTLCGFDLY